MNNIVTKKYTFNFLVFFILYHIFLSYFKVWDNCSEDPKPFNRCNHDQNVAVEVPAKGFHSN